MVDCTHGDEGNECPHRKCSATGGHLVCDKGGTAGANSNQDECNLNACEAMCAANFDGVDCAFFTHDAAEGECVLFKECGFLEVSASRTTYDAAKVSSGSLIQPSAFIPLI